MGASLKTCRRVTKRAIVGFLLIQGLLCSACLFYDSRWTQQKEERERAVERLRPAKFERRGPTSSESRVAYIKAYATPAYVAETLRWEARFEEMLQDANAVLEPAIGLKLENGGTTLWRPGQAEDRLEALLAELTAMDASDDVGWVVGFVRSIPKLEFDYHQLGVAGILSKHLVIRASNDPREFELLSHQYYRLSENEKAKLYSDRKRHRMVTVFLHEIGHTLGAQHRNGKTVIMNPLYNDEVTGFEETTLGLFQISLPKHLDRASTKETYDAVLEYYRAHADGWVGSERDRLIARLSAADGQASTGTQVVAAAPGASPTQTKQGASVAPEPVLGLDSLSKENRQRYEDALRAEASGDVHAAWKLLMPIVETNSRVREVQDLRCRIARKRGFMQVIVDAHCAPSAQLRAQAQTGAEPGR